jgi:predicted lipid-binding transport protein (Tim44 family)
LAQIQQHQHIYLPDQTPNAAQLEELKQRAPEAYELWLETTRKRVDHDIWRSQKAIRQPYLLASLGQWLGLLAVLAVLVLAGFVAHEGHGVVAGVLGVIDIIGLAAVFNGNQGRRHQQQPKQQKPKQQPQPPAGGG